MTFGAVVVAQLAERLLLTPEIRGLNPDIGNETFWTYLSVNCFPETIKIKKKRPGMAHLKKMGGAIKIRDPFKFQYQLISFIKETQHTNKQ